MSSENSQIKRLLNFYNTSLSDQFRQLTTPLATYYSFDFVAYSCTSPNGDYFDVTNLPEMAEAYFSNHLYKNSPFKLHPDNYHNGAYLPSAINDDKYCELKDKGQRQFGIKKDELIIISKKRDDCVHIFTLGTTCPQIPVAGVAINNLNIFDTFCEYIMSQWQPNFTKMDAYSINLASLMGEDFFQKKKDLYYGTELSRKQEFLRSIGMEDQDSQEFLNFTQREKECLRLVLQGKTIYDISRFLHISPRTVENHVQHIKDKLNCRTRIDILKKIEYFKLLGLY